MTLVFLINPAAGKYDRTEELTVQIHALMKSDERPYRIYRTKCPGDAEQFVRNTAESAPEEEFLFIACGGDGTLNEVVNGAVGLDNVTVTHFPTGSGNDFVRMFDPEYRAFGNLAALLHGFSVKLDMIRCCDRYSLNICSAGLDARITARVPKIKRLPLLSGSTAYLAAIAVEFFKKLAMSVKVWVDGIAHHGDYTILVAANGAYYGGGFHPMPDANPGDAILDFLLVKKVSHLRMIQLLGKYKAGRYRDCPKEMLHLTGGSMHLEAQMPITVNVDGEVFERTKVDIALAKEKLRFILPDVPELAGWKTLCAAGTNE